MKNVIWQTAPGDQTTFELQYIQEFLLKEVDYCSIFDQGTCQSVLDDSLIVYSAAGSQIPVFFQNYLDQYNQRNYRYWLLHLSNERLNHDCSYYKQAQWVFRAYYDSALVADNVTTIPIGYKSGYCNYTPNWDKNNKELIWCFAGQLKSDRFQMIADLSQLTPNFQHFTDSFNSARALAPDQLKEVYKKSVYALCPMGFSNPDSFRILEALESGTVPVVRKYSNIDYYQQVFAGHPFILVDKWSDLFAYTAPNVMEAKLEETKVWYDQYKKRLQQQIKEILCE